jgi:hypothetical protein
MARPENAILLNKPVKSPLESEGFAFGAAIFTPVAVNLNNEVATSGLGVASPKQRVVSTQRVAVTLAFGVITPKARVASLQYGVVTLHCELADTGHVVAGLHCGIRITKAGTMFPAFSSCNL